MTYQTSYDVSIYTNTVSKAMFPPSSQVQISSLYSEYILQVLLAKV